MRYAADDPGVSALLSAGRTETRTETKSAAAEGPLDVPDLEETGVGGIAWFGTWEDGLAEAKRTERPILLVSAAPHCHGVSGMW